MRPANTTSKVLAISTCLVFTLCIGLSAYFVSAMKGEIDDKNFTVSQSLAFGNKYAMVPLLVLSFVILAYLIYYRGGKYTWFRQFLISIIYSLIITIVWVTTFYSKEDHYILAGVIFASVLINIILTSNVIYDGQKIKNKSSDMILKLLPLLASIGATGIFVSKTGYVSDKVIQLFPSLENYMIVIQGASILALGFI